MNAMPFGQSPLITSGAMSFNPQMHGTTSPGIDSSSPTFIDLSEATAKKIATLQAKLNQKLGPEFLSQRPGPGGGPKLTYAEGWKVINLANEVFGFNGWSSNVISLTTDFIDFNEETRRYSIGVTAIVRVTLRDGVFHEDIGYGMLENTKSKGQALDKCKKEAVTDGLKRALRSFGNLLGNCLYDKAYIQEVMKIKVAPPKFEKSQLYRRAEFDDIKPAALTSNPPPIKVEPKSVPTKLPVPPPQAKIMSIATVHANSQQSKPTVPAFSAQKPTVTAIPPHMRTTSNNPTTVTPSKGKAPMATGLNTPITTPAHPPIVEAPRKVAFAQNADASASVADDNWDASFENSEDDALYQSIDMSDLGRPIAYDEPNDNANMSTNATSGGNSSVLSGNGLGVNSHYNMSPPTPNQQQRPQQPQTPTSRGGPGMGLQNPPPRNNRGPGSRPPPARGFLAAVITRVQEEDQRLAAQQRHQQDGGAESALPRAQQQQQLPQQQPGGIQLHQNQQKQPQQQQPSQSMSRRPSTPGSGGGFHFPTGMPPAPQTQSFRPPPPPAMAGMKRGADAMDSPLNKPPGMGMSAQRQPLGRLDLGEGGEVKRIKR